MIGVEFENISDVYERNPLFDNLDTILEKFKKFSEEVGIFCTSMKFNNTLMWSHYADSHKGVVIELSPNLKKNSMLNLSTPVNYSNKRPMAFESENDLQKYHLHPDEFIIKYIKLISHTKGTEWAYEEEQRMYISRCEEKGLIHKIYENEIKRLYLGCNMDVVNKNELAKCAFLKYPSIEIYDMHQDNHMYTLNPVLRYSQTKDFVL